MRTIKLVKKTEFWVPTLWGWILFLSVLSLTVFVYFTSVHAFLAVSNPVRGQILVVEGWIPPSALERAAMEFKDHGYDRLVLTGGSRRWTVSVLKGAGVREDRIAVLPEKHVQKDRTYSSAVSLREWLAVFSPSDRKIDILTLGVHARRSWLIYRSVLGDGYATGVIASDNPGYDPSQWWKSTEGLRSITFETLAYIYTWLFLVSDHSGK